VTEQHQRSTWDRSVEAAHDAYDHAANRFGERVAGAVERVPDPIKPKLRGWLHAGTFPLSLAAGIVLVALAGSGPETWACAVYALSACLLFGVSALYHRGRWSPRVQGLLKRLDHANIFLIIAGTYTPFTVVLLSGRTQEVLLTVVWAAAISGVIFRVAWVGAPRWLYVPAYVGLGWAAVFFLPEFLHSGGVAVFVLLIVGGLLYTVGGLVYATRRPDPSPRWFGFHEVFHALTLVAYVVHYVAVSIAVYTH